MTPMTQRAPSGARVVREGVRPGVNVVGRPARDEHGQTLCVVCLEPNDPDHPRSPYCADCKQASVGRSAKRRNVKRQSADDNRRSLRSEPHWEGERGAYTHGRAGLYLDRGTVDGIRDALGASLAGYPVWAEIAAGGYDEAQGRAYHRALNDLLLSVRDLNDWLRGPLWPATDKRATRRTGAAS